MSLKCQKAPAYAEINDIPEVRGEDVPNARRVFIQATGRDTTLSDDDIVNIIAWTCDGYDDEGMVQAMLLVEDGKLPTNLMGVASWRIFD